MARVGHESVPLVRQRLSAADGFGSEKEAAAWGDKACGAACLRMVLLFFGVQHAPTVKDLMMDGVRRGLFKEHIGWVHKGIAQVAAEHGLEGMACSMKADPLEIVRALEGGGLLIASVSLGFQADKRGGHLIVVHRVNVEEGRITTLFFCDPSGWGQTHSNISAERFFLSWTGNVIVVSKKSEGA